MSWSRSVLFMSLAFFLSGVGAYLGMGLTAKATFFVAGACGLMGFALDQLMSGLWKPAIAAGVCGLLAGTIGLGVNLPLIGNGLVADGVKRSGSGGSPEGVAIAVATPTSTMAVIPTPSATATPSAAPVQEPTRVAGQSVGTAPKAGAVGATTPMTAAPAARPAATPAPTISESLVKPCTQVPAGLAGSFAELVDRWGGPLAPVGTPMSYRIETRVLAFDTPWNDAHISIFKVTPSCTRVLVRTLAPGEFATIDSFVGQLFEARWAEEVFVDGKVLVKTGDLNVTCFAGIEEDSGCLKAVMTANYFI
ncbi:MAG: hypothetical protein IPL93_15325 [Actinomycetales bacterium]|nr:hypothetical protein [Actinomycetales bacterium]